MSPFGEAVLEAAGASLVASEEPDSVVREFRSLRKPHPNALGDDLAGGRLDASLMIPDRL